MLSNTKIRKMFELYVPYSSKRGDEFSQNTRQQTGLAVL